MVDVSTNQVVDVSTNQVVDVCILTIRFFEDSLKQRVIKNIGLDFFFPVLNYCGRMVQKIVYFHFLFCNLNQEILPV